MVFYNILIGPLSNPSVLGNYVHHPKIKTFNKVNQPNNQSPILYDPYCANSHFNDILSQLPKTWIPDIVIWWHLVNEPIPPGIADCPYPTAVIPTDWSYHGLLSISYSHAFDFIFCDRLMEKTLTAFGQQNCTYWPCFSFDPLVHYPRTHLEKTYDVMFLGNTHYWTHPQRAPYLKQLALLGQKYKIYIGKGYPCHQYAELMNQSWLTFNCSTRQEMNLRGYEAPASYSLVLMEEENLEVSDFLKDKKECLLYNQDNFVTLISHYLENKANIEIMTQAGHQKIQDFSYERQFERLLDLLPQAIASFHGPANRLFNQKSPIEKTFLAAWQLRTSGAPARAIDVLKTLEPLKDFRLLNLAGCLWMEELDESHSERYQATLKITCALFKAAILDQPQNPVLDLNLAENLLLLSDYEQALQHYQIAMDKLRVFDISQLDHPGHFAIPLGGSLFIMNARFALEFERLRIQCATQIDVDSTLCKQLFYWQMYHRMGTVFFQAQRYKKAIESYQKALLLYPDFGEIEQLLARAYRSLGLYTDALVAYSRALDKQPFDESLALEIAELEVNGFPFHEMHALTNALLIQLEVWETMKYLKEKVAKQNEQALFGYLLLNHEKWDILIKKLNQLSPSKGHALLSQLSTAAVFEDNAVLNQLLSPFIARLHTAIPEWISPIEDEPRIDFSYLPPLPGQAVTTTQLALSHDVIPFKRTYDAQSSLEEQSITPHYLPYGFPVPPLSSTLVIQDLQDLNILFISSCWQDAKVVSWFKSFAHSFHPHSNTTVLLWHPLEKPTAEDLSYLEAELGFESSFTISLLTDSFIPDEQAQFLSQVDFVVVEPTDWLNFYAWWSLYLGTPVWFLKEPFQPYPSLDRTWIDVFIEQDWAAGFHRYFTNLEHYKKQAKTVQCELNTFYQTVAKQQTTNFLWQLKLHLVLADAEGNKVCAKV